MFAPDSHPLSAKCSESMIRFLHCCYPLFDLSPPNSISYHLKFFHQRILCRTYTSYLLVTLLLTTCLYASLLSSSVPLAFAAPDTQSQTVLRLGASTENDTYWQFANFLSTSLQQKNSPIRITPIATQGSEDNLQRLEHAALELALVQSDIAYQTFEGIRLRKLYDEFSLVSILYREFIFVIVPIDSDISHLRDLRDKKLYIGPRGSSIYHNAIDILQELGLEPQINYDIIHLDQAWTRFGALDSGVVDALIDLGGELPSEIRSNLSDYRLIPISQELVARSKVSNPYLLPDTYVEDRIELQHTTASLLTFLIARDDVEKSVIYRLFRDIEDVVPRFLDEMQSSQTPVPHEDAVKFAVVAWHPGVESFLLEQGIIVGDNVLLIGVTTALCLFGAYFAANLYTRRYNRLGSVTNTKIFFLASMLSQAGAAILVIALLVLVMTVVVEVIRYAEADYAAQYNIENAFVNMRFRDALMWVFRFAGAGDSGDAFPSSPIGKAVALLLPFASFAAVFSLSLISIDKVRSRIAKLNQGLGRVNVSGHILICGWNEKAPGIIYALTSTDAPFRQKVVVVAEMEGTTPLQKYRFNSKYVLYCRGDSSDIRTLKRACFHRARGAIVLAGRRKVRSRNIKSVLTVLKLRQVSDMFIAVELMFSENRHLFEVCGANAIVPTRLLSNLMAANAAISGLTLDYIMDMLTFDDREELYSCLVGDVRDALNTRVKRVGTQKNASVSLQRLAHELAAVGVTVVALAKDGNFEEKGISGLGRKSYAFPGNSSIAELSDKDSILYAANEERILKVVLSGIGRRSGKPREPVSSEKSGVDPASLSVAIVGDCIRCTEVAVVMEQVQWVEKVTVITEQVDQGMRREIAPIQGAFTEEATWERAKLQEADAILILTKSHSDVVSPELDDYELNAEAILLGRLVKEYLDGQRTIGKRPRIVAEMYGSEARELFLDAGVDQVFSVSLLVERMLAKVVYSRGVVIDFLLQLLAVSNDVVLYSYEVTVNDVSLMGRSFASLRAGLCSGSELLGVLPLEGRDQYRNDLKDFEYHLEVGGDLQYRCKVGDTLILARLKKPGLSELSSIRGSEVGA